ncbi:ATP-binding protein, partial [Nitrospinota bacterium]
LGIRRDFLMPHVLKTVFVLDSFTVSEAAERLCLPVKTTTDLLEEWKDLKAIEALSSSGYQAATRRYTMTNEGRRRAREYMRLSGYIGPVPVPVATYKELVKKQTVLGVQVNHESLKKALSHLVVSDRLFKPLGPAVNSGRTIFLYGPPGNGKTAIAVALSSLLGGRVAIPKAVEMDGFVMRLFDPSIHRPDGDQPEDVRWTRCKRPIVVVGGELTIEMMELRMDSSSNTYEAPPHVKSNNGIFILDDFGRQLVRPRDLLNRWIVPLENRVDFLSLHTGNKVELPFDQLVIFSTNINPKDLLDEAFMRRLRHKVYIGPLELHGFKEAFQMACVSKKVPFNEEVFNTIIKEVYEPQKLPFNGCHPRDLLDHLIDLAKFEEKTPEMTQDLLMRACESYFVQIEDDSDTFASSAGVADLLK